jgi:hypothetical protein
MGLFKPKPPIDIDEFDWLIACFAWLHSKLREPVGDTPMVPVLALDTEPAIVSAQSGEDMFEVVKALAGMQNWECRLEQGDPLREDIAHSSFGQHSSQHALGLFSIEGNMPVIRYSPELLQNSEALVATFAHELSHLLTVSLGDPPGGHDLHEHATDCAAAYLGFGVFLANSARNFAQFQDAHIQGWHSSTSGYLSENALVTATAIFVRLFEIDPAPAIPRLKPYLRGDFAKALKYVDWRHPDVAQALAAVDLADWA